LSRKLLAVIAILAGLAGAVYSAFFIWFIAMMRGWSHVRDSGGDAEDYLLFAAGLVVSGLATFWGIRQQRRPKGDAASPPEN
jgi:H+/Cl- antiporter ClcA